MIKNKILFTALFAFTANLFMQTSFAMQKSVSTPKATTKSINTAPKKSKLNAMLKRQLMLQALEKDESSDGLLEQISYLIISIIMGGATAAAFNHDKIIPLFEQLTSKNKKSMNSPEEKFGYECLKFVSKLFPSLDPDRSSDLIKIGAIFTVSSLGYYIVLNVLFHYMNKKDNSEEKILRLVTLLDQLNN